MVDLRDIFEEDNISISKEWLEEVEDYQLKILLLTSVLADNSLAFRGTLKTMCEWLGVKSCTVNNRKIKEALQNLADKGYIFYKVEGRTHHVSISNKGMKDKKIYKVRKIWIEAFKNYQKVADKSISIDWIKILRVFIYLYYLRTGELITLEKIANITDISTETARKALIAILACDLKGLHTDKAIIKEKYQDEKGNTYWRTRGQDIFIHINFENDIKL